MSCALGKWSLHSRWNFISTFAELHVHGDERWPTEVTSSTYFRGFSMCATLSFFVFRWREVLDSDKFDGVTAMRRLILRMPCVAKVLCLRVTFRRFWVLSLGCLAGRVKHRTLIYTRNIYSLQLEGQIWWCPQNVDKRINLKKKTLPLLLDVRIQPKTSWFGDLLRPLPMANPLSIVTVPWYRAVYFTSVSLVTGGGVGWGGVEDSASSLLGNLVHKMFFFPEGLWFSLQTYMIFTKCLTQWPQTSTYHYSSLHR